MVERSLGQTAVESVVTRVCPCCGEGKPESDWRPSDWHGHPGSKGWCRVCRNSYEKAWRDARDPETKAHDRRVRSDRERERGRRVRAADPKGYGDRQRRWLYSLEPEQYDQMVIQQGGYCANPLCRSPLSHVDHDHTCCPGEGKTCGECVRGLLCRECNLALGIMGDSADRLLGLVEYLIGGEGPMGQFPSN